MGGNPSSIFDADFQPALRCSCDVSCARRGVYDASALRRRKNKMQAGSTHKIGNEGDQLREKRASETACESRQQKLDFR
jgi:hypothetical protein